MQSRVNDNVRWGIIGVGDVCTVKSGPVFGAVAGSALVAVSRRTPGAAEAYAKQHGVPHYFDNAEAVIACEDVDAVYIATPPNSHLPLALMVAAAGKPCLLEKPMARCSSEAAVIAGAFERAGVPLWIAYYRRALPRYRQARDWLPRVGAVREVLCCVWRDKAEDGWRFQRSISGGGLTVDIGSHCMDILDWMLGPLLVEDATSGRRQPVPAGADPADVVEDYSTIRFTLGLHSDARGIAEFDFKRAEDPTDEITITGTNGTLRFAALGLRGASENVIFTPHLPSSTEPSSVHVPAPQHAHSGLVEEIVHDLRTGQSTCSATGLAGLRTAVVIDAALEKADVHARLWMGSYRRSR